MNATYKKLLKKLVEKYPGKHIHISPHYDYYDHVDEYKTQYYVYAEDVESKHCKTLSDVKAYVEQLCKKGE